MLTSLAIGITLMTVMPLVIIEFPGGEGGSSTKTKYDNLVIYSSILGPFEGQYDEDMTWTIYNPKGKSYADTVSIYADMTSVVTIDNVTTTITYNVSQREKQYTIALDGSHTWYFDFNYYSSNSNVYGHPYTIDFNLYESATGTNPVYYKSSSFTFSDRESHELTTFSPTARYFQYSNDSSYRVSNERYIVSSSLDYLYLDSNRFDIDFSFTYNPGDLPVDNKFTCEEAYILVNDYANVYPYMTKTEGDSSFKIELDVSYDESTNDVTLSIKDDMYYVNPNSLDMYDVKTYGTAKKYSKTNDFYVPAGKMDKAKENTYRLVLNGCGYNKVNLYKDLNYLPEKDYFSSNCNTSHYCVVVPKDD